MTALAASLLALTTAACGGMGDPLEYESRHTPTAKEAAAARLVEAQGGEPVECHDNGAVNSELHPEHPIGYSCFDEAGEFYNIVIAADGHIVSFRGPVKLERAGS